LGFLFCVGHSSIMRYSGGCLRIACTPEDKGEYPLMETELCRREGVHSK
jgi:hypothetical protein